MILQKKGCIIISEPANNELFMTIVEYILITLVMSGILTSCFVITINLLVNREQNLKKRKNL
jgi:hypothetical protein